MSGKKRVAIRKLPTGVPGLDEILGGGLPEYSFNILGGSPGGGKTTLAHQIMFANATAERPALFFTVMGEPGIKMLRYQQQFEFFDLAKIDVSIRYANLSQLVQESSLDRVLDEIVKQVETLSPSIVVVDSFRAMARKIHTTTSHLELQGFIERLALHLTSWQATTFLLGEYSEQDVRDNPVFTIADGLMWLSQQAEGNSVIRKMQIIKLRGQAPIPGMHTFRITNKGLQTFPRTFGLDVADDAEWDGRRLSCGVKGLDEMLGGGIPAGDSVLVAGPSGAGKSLLASNFLAEGLGRGEAAVAAIFDERPASYLARADAMGLDFAKHLRSGLLKILYLRPLDLSLDETVYEIVDAVRHGKAKRLVIDSLGGLEIALTPGFRSDFRESLYRMIMALTGRGVTIISTVEVQDSFQAFPFSSHAVSFLADDLIRMRYVSIDGEMRRILATVKMRRGKHSKDLREYEITSDGIVLKDILRGFRGLVSGVPEADINLVRPHEVERNE